MDANEFNTILAKNLRGLKKHTCASSVRQGYKGTGSQKHKRQISVSWDQHDCSCDVWLLNGCVYFRSHYNSTGGRPNTRQPLPGSQDPILALGKTPGDVYGEILAYIKAWLPEG